MRILVCEDHDSIRKMIETLVSARGHEVVGVTNGTKAVDRALSEPFDVLLLDLMLPGPVDGFAVCRKLRSEPVTAGLPIVIISAMDDTASRDRALDAGANAFYGKPFRPTELLKELDRTSQRMMSASSIARDSS